jgi:hypothetical protein
VYVFKVSKSYPVNSFALNEAPLGGGSLPPSGVDYVPVLTEKHFFNLGTL